MSYRKYFTGLSPPLYFSFFPFRLSQRRKRNPLKTRQIENEDGSKGSGGKNTYFHSPFLLFFSFSSIGAYYFDIACLFLLTIAYQNMFFRYFDAALSVKTFHPTFEMRFLFNRFPTLLFKQRPSSYQSTDCRK